MASDKNTPPMKKETIEGNKLIALFMGEAVGSNGLLGIHQQNGDIEYEIPLDYNGSWEWLMPVVEKIQSIDIEPAPNYRGYRIEIVIGCYVKITGFPMPPISKNVSIVGSDIEATWQAVVEFIKWYNSKTHSPMNTTQLAVGMTVYRNSFRGMNKNADIFIINLPFKIDEKDIDGFWWIRVDDFCRILFSEEDVSQYFTTTPPDQVTDNASRLLNGFNDGLHRSSGIGGQPPEFSNPDQEGKREEPYHEIIDSTEELISQLQSRVKELEGLNEAAEKHIEIITRERDWQTDVVVPDLDQQIADLKQENERLKGGIYPAVAYGIGVGQCYPASEQFSKEDLNDYGKKFIEKIIPTLPPTATTTDEQTDK